MKYLAAAVALLVITGVAFTLTQHMTSPGAATSESGGESLSRKKAQLAALQDALTHIESDIARMQSEVGTCPITGKPNQFILKEDPRPGLRAQITALQKEIAASAAN